MKLRVLFFGATSEIAGTRLTDIEADEGCASRQILDQVLTDHPRLKAHRLHLSVNQQYATGDEILVDGDELAIFTAVSGG